MLRVLIQLFLRAWYLLPEKWKYILSAVPLTIGLVLAVVLWNWIPIAVGAFLSAVLFILPGPSESEKKGYHF